MPDDEDVLSIEIGGKTVGGNLDGVITPHIHPTGWVSGVLYVSGAQGPDGRHRGPLVLGYTQEMGENAPWGMREIEPFRAISSCSLPMSRT
jgi:hypothetical protein